MSIMDEAEMLRRLEEAIATSANGDTPGSYDDDLRLLLLDWPTFWDIDRTEAEWLAEPIIAAHRSHALFAPGGTGKSLLALWIAAAIATGRPIFGRHNPPRHVLYLDYEMTADDLAERLENMGYGPEHDLTRLHYALLPSLPGLDQPDGGKAVIRLAQLCDAELVIIDTFGRAVHGDENEADTVRAWYRWTGLHLKAEGRAFLRVDHAGKDIEKGQRGTSAKNDDVDVVWRLARQDGETFKLVAKKRRMSWVPETVDLVLKEDDHLEYALLAGTSYPTGTKDVVDLLVELDVPIDASQRQAAKTLKEAGKGRRAELVRAAQRWRNAEIPTHFQGPESASRKNGTHPSDGGWDAVAGRTIDENANMQVDGSGRTTGRTGTHPRGTTGTRSVSIDTDAPSASPETDPAEELFWTPPPKEHNR
jgi:hypothetical protein